MAIPSTAIILGTTDPANLLDYPVIIKQGVGGLLEAGEGIYSYTLTPTAEAIAAGLQLLNSGPYGIVLGDDLVLRFWVTFAPDMVNDPMFAGSGVILGLDLLIVTTNVPPRRYKLTIGLRVALQ